MSNPWAKLDRKVKHQGQEVAEQISRIYDTTTGPAKYDEAWLESTRAKPRRAAREPDIFRGSIAIV